MIGDGTKQQLALSGGVESALSGLRVLELADAKGAWCGKLLADMGAEVIKVEAPDGDPLRRQPPLTAGSAGDRQGLTFLYWNTSKQSVRLAIETPEGRRQLEALLHHADVLIETLAPGRLAELGLSYATLRRVNPGLVWTSITGFGQTGPHRHYQSSDLVAAAMAGVPHVVGYADDAPVKLAGSQSYVMASTLAAIGSLVALRERRRSGWGQQVDISLQEAMLSVSSICGVGKWLEDGVVPRRFGPGLFAAIPSGTYPCRDGKVYLIVNRPRHWQVLAQWVHEITGNVEILEAMFEGPSSSRQPYRELLDLYIGEMTERMTVDHCYREGQRRHLAVTPLHTAISLLADPHLRARRFFTSPADNAEPEPGVTARLNYPGPPYRLSLTPACMRSVAPGLGAPDGQLGDLLGRWSDRSAMAITPSPEKEAGDGPLAGLRVVEFSAGMAGPWIGRYLAWCGADVIKIESRDYPDVTRLYVSPREPELGVQEASSPWFTDWNAGKRFLALDLQKPEAVALARDLIGRSDIVIDNNANGVLDKLGLGFASLRAIKSSLVLLSSTGFGRVGPDASYISWGPNIETLSALSSVSGFTHRDCTMTQFAYPDALSALYGLFAILCALVYRDRQGLGQDIDLSQQEATIASIGELMLEASAGGARLGSTGNYSPGGAPEGCYPCAGEDRWCAISVMDDDQWFGLCRALGGTVWLADRRFADHRLRRQNRDALDSLIAQATSGRDACELMVSLQARGVAAGVVQTVEDQYGRDSHLAARGYFETITHFGKGQAVAPGIPLVFSATPGCTRDSGRSIGHDNKAICCELLGLPEEQYQHYLKQGVVQA